MTVKIKRNDIQQAEQVGSIDVLYDDADVNLFEIAADSFHDEQIEKNISQYNKIIVSINHSKTTQDIAIRLNVGETIRSAGLYYKFSQDERDQRALTHVFDVPDEYLGAVRIFNLSGEDATIRHLKVSGKK